MEDVAPKDQMKAAPDAVLIVSAQGRILAVNDRAEGMFGWPRRELLGQSLDRVSPECFRRSFDRPSAWNGASSGYGVEVLCLRRAGAAFTAVVSCSPMPSGDVILAVRDLSERDRMQEELRSLADALKTRAAEQEFQKNTLQSILNSMSDGVVVCDPRGRLLLINAAATRLMPHAARTDLRPEEWADEFGLYLPDETTPYPPDRLPLARVRGGEVVNNVEIFVRHADAPEGIWVSVNGRPLQDSEGNRVGGVIVIRDITTDKFAESALLAGQEMERKRISRELHDSVSQSLSALILETEIIKQELPESETAPRGVFDSHINRLQTLDEDISRVARQLHPSLLERFGLVAALQQLSDEITRRGELAVDFSFQDVPSAIVRSSELCLYRVAQEALRNVARHAGARQATLSLQGECGRLILCVEDQGAGFDLDAVAGKARLGLVNMRERVRIAGGSLSIHSRPGRGTRIEVQVPALRAANVQAH